MHFELEPRVQCQLDRIESHLGALRPSLEDLLKGQQKIMATAASILAQIAQEKTDIAALTTLTANLVAAFKAQVAGSFTSDELASISAALTDDDASVESINTVITAALGAAAPPTPTSSQVASATATLSNSGTPVAPPVTVTTTTTTVTPTDPTSATPVVGAPSPEPTAPAGSVKPSV
jgi:hypothetical protein